MNIPFSKVRLCAFVSYEPMPVLGLLCLTWLLIAAFSGCSANQEMIVPRSSAAFAAKSREFKFDSVQAKSILYSQVDIATDARVTELMKLRTSNGHFGYVGIVGDCHFFGLVQKGEYRDAKAMLTGFYVNGCTGEVQFRRF